MLVDIYCTAEIAVSCWWRMFVDMHCLQGLLRGLEGFPGLGGDRSLAGAGQEGQVVQPLSAGSLGSRNRRVPKRVPLYVRVY